MQQQQSPPPSVRIDQTLPVNCEYCNGMTFQEAFLLRKVSKFLVAASEDTIQPIPTMVCTECGKPLKEFIPAAIKGHPDGTNE